MIFAQRLRKSNEERTAEEAMREKLARYKDESEKVSLSAKST